MEEKTLLEILNRISILIRKDDIVNAREYLQIEIDNLKNITPQKCKNTKYHFYNSFCNKCSNYNCSENKTKIK